MLLQLWKLSTRERRAGQRLIQSLGNTVRESYSLCLVSSHLLPFDVRFETIRKTPVYLGPVLCARAKKLAVFDPDNLRESASLLTFQRQSPKFRT